MKEIVPDSLDSLFYRNKIFKALELTVNILLGQPVLGIINVTIVVFLFLYVSITLNDGSRIYVMNEKEIYNLQLPLKKCM